MGARRGDEYRNPDVWTETGMRRTPATWSEAMADEVRQRLRDAMQTLRRMRMPSGSFPAGYSSAWPDVVQDFWEVYGQHATHVTRIRPSPARSEARRVGKECVSKCRSRGSPDH